MTPLLTLIQEQEKMYMNTPITQQRIWDTMNEEQKIAMKAQFLDIKSFHRQTIISLLEGEIEKCREMRVFEGTDFDSGFNAALDLRIEYYTSVLDELKKSV